MKTRCERPYRDMIATAAAVRRLPEHASEWHVRRLAAELAHAVRDLDARMCAGLIPPRAWQSGEQAREPHE